MFIRSPQPLRPITEILQLLRFPVVVSSKICCSRSRNSSLVESHRNFDNFGGAIFPVTRGTSQICKQSTSPYLLLWESGLFTAVMLNDVYQAATKDEIDCTLTKNRIQTMYLSHYFSSTRQNDYIIMTWSENSSLQCFRTVPLSMVAPNSESWNHLDCVYVDNHSKT